jgi:hypothetical protein
MQETFKKMLLNKIPWNNFDFGPSLSGILKSTLHIFQTVELAEYIKSWYKIYEE